MAEEETEAEKAAKARGYSQGYAAGQKRAAREDAREDFRRAAFLAALPACANGSNWKKGETPITTLKGRTELAWDFADEALRRAHF